MASEAPERTDYTLTIEGRVTGTVMVGSTDPVKAGKWLRDVAIPNSMLAQSPVKWDWATAKATWDGDEPELGETLAEAIVALGNEAMS